MKTSARKPAAFVARPQKEARDECQQIVIWMAPTERTRRKDDVAVMIGADLWKKIYLAAKRGAK